MSHHTIFLIGFMGSGKTTIGKKLAARLGYGFTDLDAAVEIAEGQHIHDIINTKGESYFREVESRTLKNIALTDKVISTGGGAPCFFDNIDWMKAHGTLVFINPNEGVIFSRLKTTDLSRRPLLAGLDDAGLKDFIRIRRAERMAFYMQADIILETIDVSISDLAVRVRSQESKTKNQESRVKNQESRTKNDELSAMDS